MERPPTRVDVVHPSDQPDPSEPDPSEPGTAATVVRVIGDLDATAAPLLQHALTIEMTPGASVVVDLTECHFLDSVGIGVLVFGWQTGEKVGAGFLLRNVPAYPHRVLTLVGLDTLIPIV
jgi:anti-anti-sigma factor